MVTHTLRERESAEKEGGEGGQKAQLEYSSTASGMEKGGRSLTLSDIFDTCLFKDDASREEVRAHARTRMHRQAEAKQSCLSPA